MRVEMQQRHRPVQFRRGCRGSMASPMSYGLTTMSPASTALPFKRLVHIARTGPAVRGVSRLTTT
jgi:hypothetical protein